LPRRLLVIGGGPVGCELGQAFARLGARVTIATKGGRVLPREDDEAAAALAAVLRADGIEVRGEAADATGYDAVLVAAGRRPNVEGLNLGAAGVAFDAGNGVRAEGTAGFVKVGAWGGELWDATVVGPHAGELIGTISLAMTNGVGPKRIAETVFPYPTYTEALRKVADQYNRTRLTPLAKRLLGG